MVKLGAIAAPAKINLCLHVVGQRADGYHLLDSIVAPVGVQDELSLCIDESLSEDRLRVTGGTIDGPSQDNLVLKAIERFRTHLSAQGTVLPPISGRLTKTLPVAAGLGGGSSDAVAALRLVADWAEGNGTSISENELAAIALTLGADCPFFLHGITARMQGIGECLEPLPGWEALSVVLVNPGVPVSTPQIFKQLEDRHQPKLPNLPAATTLPADRMAWLNRNTRNDLQAPAIAVEHVIQDVLNAIAATQDCALARMSGSGATCFGVYADSTSAADAAAQVQAEHPDWWIIDTQTVSYIKEPAP
ncbi:MAG: 4-(cytidine 5'-diphospho)-2-C-methyl-D-erythritol kinase [Pseudomonadota bacterium]